MSTVSPTPLWRPAAVSLLVMLAGGGIALAQGQRAIGDARGGGTGFQRGSFRDRMFRAGLGRRLGYARQSLGISGLTEPAGALGQRARAGWRTPRGRSTLASLYANTVQTGPLGLGAGELRPLSRVQLLTETMQPPGEIAVPIQSWADGDAPAWGKGPGGQAEDPRSLEERAADYVTRRQRAYLAEGWAHFKEGRYRRAYDAFNLAESVNADDVETRASIKLAMMYAATGAKQYGLARAALGWLLQPDPRTGQLRDPRFAQRTPDVAAQCASEQTFARDFIEAVRAAAAGTGAPASVRALQVMVFWGGREGHRVDALSYARRLAEDAEAELPWSRVYAAIRLAQAAAPDSAERGADLGLPDFVSLGLPFERGNPER